MKLQILHIIPNLLKGGAERLVIDIVRELSKNKDLTIRLVLFENRIEYDVEDIKQLIHVIPSTVKLSLIKKNECNINFLQELLDDFKPDIIHSHLFEAEIISRSCFYPNAKWFSHCHDNMKQFRTFDFQTLLIKKTLTNYYEKKYLFNRYKKNGGTHFIAISKSTKKYIDKIRDSFKISVLPNAVKYYRFHQNLILKTNNKILKLINIGSFQEKKNQIFLIESAKILKQKNISFEMHFLGDGITQSIILKKINEYELNNYIYLHGNVEKVEQFLWQSDMYIHAATDEPFGLTLIEAMAAGLPVITLDGKGNRDLIEQGKNGYMLFEENAEKFANIITDLWNDKNKYQEISNYAQQFAQQYDIKAYCVNLLNLYKNNTN